MRSLTGSYKLIDEPLDLRSYLLLHKVKLGGTRVQHGVEISEVGEFTFEDVSDVFL